MRIGTSSLLIALSILSNINMGKGLILGGITGVSPTDVVIINRYCREYM